MATRTATQHTTRKKHGRNETNAAQLNHHVSCTTQPRGYLSLQLAQISGISDSIHNQQWANSQKFQKPNRKVPNLSLLHWPYGKRRTERCVWRADMLWSQGQAGVGLNTPVLCKPEHNPDSAKDTRILLQP